MDISREILQFLHYHPFSSRDEIAQGILIRTQLPAVTLFTDEEMERLLRESRTADGKTKDYKKAMLIFYEQNNIFAFKQIFIDQFAFAVREYF